MPRAADAAATTSWVWVVSAILAAVRPRRVFVARVSSWSRGLGQGMCGGLLMGAWAAGLQLGRNLLVLRDGTVSGARSTCPCRACPACWSWMCCGWGWSWLVLGVGGEFGVLAQDLLA